MKSMTSPTSPRRRLLALAAAGVAVLALAGCGDDDGSAGTDPETTPEASPTETVKTTESADPGTRTSENIELESPAEGETVSGSFEASGKANSPEANVPWEIRSSDGDVVLDGFVTAKGWMDKLYPWSTTVDVSSLEPGDYVFVAMTDDPSGGEGKPAEEVSANITVE
jgi:hypothetical protein